MKIHNSKVRMIETTPPREAEQRTLPEKIVANSVRSVTQWYPPFVLYANPKIEEFLTKLFPPSKHVFDFGRTFVEAGKRLWSQATAPLLGNEDPVQLPQRIKSSVK